MVLLETTAGTGTALGATFEELAALRDAIGESVRHRIAFCADTCHLYSAGYDLVRDYDGVWRRWDADRRAGAVSAASISTTPRRRSAPAATGTSWWARDRWDPSRSAGSCATRASAR